MGIMTGVEAAIVSRLGDTSWLGSLVSAGLTFWSQASAVGKQPWRLQAMYWK